MLALLMVILPLLFAAAAPILRKRPLALYSLLPATGVSHCLVLVAGLLYPEQDLLCLYLGGTPILAVDAVNRFFLQLIAGLFLVISIYTFFWLPAAQEHNPPRTPGTRTMHRYLFVLFMLVFVSMMNLSILLISTAMAIEASTWPAPLILFHARSLSGGNGSTCCSAPSASASIVRHIAAFAGKISAACRPALVLPICLLRGDIPPCVVRSVLCSPGRFRHRWAWRLPFLMPDASEAPAPVLPMHC